MKRLFENIGINLPSDAITIGDDLTLCALDSRNTPTISKEPHKLTHAIIGICTSGSCCIRLNLNEYEIDGPMLITLMPGQILEQIDYSPNFQGYLISLSKRFIDMLNLPGWQQQYMQLYNNPLTEISADMLKHISIFYAILYRAAKNEANPFRLQVIENLIRVFYYGGVGTVPQLSKSQHTYKNSIVERFMELVAKHYREERLIGFYADKLCITPKYLSKLIKDNTGRSAGEWIENHVILEARAMLQSSDMTIQQIATSLNFPNQSFFGKYFKRATGMSPKQYRSKS